MEQDQHRMKIPVEGETVELKESPGEWKEIVKTCAAFATAHGGRIFIGVSDNGQPVGVRIGKGTLEDLTNKIVQNTHPKIVPSLDTLKIRGKTLVRLDVQENPAKPVYAFDCCVVPERRTRRSRPKKRQIYISLPVELLGMRQCWTGHPPMTSMLKRCLVS